MIVAVEEQEEGLEVTGSSAAVQNILQLLVKASKALRLYRAGNNLCEHLEGTVFAEMSVHLDEQGALELGVRECDIAWKGGIVYESYDPNHNLARLLYRDGIRWIAFNPGLERLELHTFLECLKQATLIKREQDDLVTLFWSCEFQSIRYVAVNELSTEAGDSSFESRIVAGAAGPRGTRARAEGSVSSDRSGAPGGGVDPEAVSAKDLPQPVKHLPIEATSLSEQEIGVLGEEVLGEDETDPTMVTMELAVELTILDNSEEERQKLADQLVAIVRLRLLSGEFTAVMKCVRHLVSITSERFEGSAPIGNLRSTLLRGMATPDLLKALLDQADRSHTLNPKELTAYLVTLESEALPWLIPLMGRPRSPSLRRAVTNALIAAGERSVTLLSDYLSCSGKSAGTVFLGEAFHLMAHFNNEAVLPCLSSLLELKDAVIRRHTARALGRFDHFGVDTLCMQLQGDEDPEVRSAALDSLVMRDRRESAGHLLEQVVSASQFCKRPLAEKRRVFAAVARLGGEEVLDWFSMFLWQSGSQWFSGRHEREMLQAAAYGVRKINTESAWKLLYDLASTATRIVRTASKRELRDRNHEP